MRSEGGESVWYVVFGGDSDSLSPTLAHSLTADMVSLLLCLLNVWQ